MALQPWRLCKAPPKFLNMYAPYLQILFIHSPFTVRSRPERRSRTHTRRVMDRSVLVDMLIFSSSSNRTAWGSLQPLRLTYVLFSHFFDTIVQTLFAHFIQRLGNFLERFQAGEPSNQYQARDIAVL